MTTHIDGVDGLQALVGEHLGWSDWHIVDQEQVNQFADATGDHQWIHVDPERAKAESPFGGPIAHGHLTLSLATSLMPEVMTVSGITFGLNYGSNRVRFPAPVPVGSRIRAGATLESVEDVTGGKQAVVKVEVQVEGTEKPACVAEMVYRYYP
jgi:acyl dehydratase